MTIYPTDKRNLEIECRTRLSGYHHLVIIEMLGVYYSEWFGGASLWRCSLLQA